MSRRYEFHPVHSLGSTWLTIALISGMVSLLSLAGAIYMFQVLDRVLTSRSVETLVALSILATGAFLVLAGLDAIRAQMLLRIGERIDAELMPRAQAAAASLALSDRSAGEALQAVRHVDTVRGYFAGPGPVALLDVAWTPVFLIFLWLLHPTLGGAALGSIVLLAASALIANRLIGRLEADAPAGLSTRLGELDAGFRNAEAVAAMGMSAHAAGRLAARNEDYLATLRRIGDTAAVQGAFSRLLRMTLQTGIIGLGAWLALQGDITAGAIAAGSIAAMRALGPVEQAIASWRPLVAAYRAAACVAGAQSRSDAGKRRNGPTSARGTPRVAPDDVTSGTSPDADTTSATLVVDRLSIRPPGAARATLDSVSLVLKAGEALAVMGHIGAGKSTLARGLVGIWPALAGSVKFDGTSIEHWQDEERSCRIGYMPQQVAVFPATIAANIARLDDHAPVADVQEAARAAGLHDAILNLPRGYKTELASDGAPLSAGQRQQLALARALYRNPLLLVLDEPNSSLDGQAEARLADAIANARRRGAIVVVITHRRSLVHCVDLVAVLGGGRLQSCITRDAFLSRHQRATRTHAPSASVPVPVLTASRRDGSLS